MKVFQFSEDMRVIRIMNPANIYLFKVNYRNTGKRCEICSKLTINTNDVNNVVLVGFFC